MRLRHAVLCALPVTLSLVGCAGATAGGSAQVDAARRARAPNESARPYGLFVPKSDGPVPLVVVLHGYSIDGAREVRMLRLAALARAKGFALAWPDGTKDAKGYRFWNATDACCNWSGSSVDDSSYLVEVIDEIARDHAIDRKRVYIVGHSNGAFMAHRFACDHADKVSAIATLAGVPWNDETRCAPSEPVSVLHMQGTKDPFILPEGGHIEENPSYPSADETVAQWARRNRCRTSRQAKDGLFDFDAKVPGSETRMETYGACAAGTTVELWSLGGSDHEPEATNDYAAAIYAFFMAHPKP